MNLFVKLIWFSIGKHNIYQTKLAYNLRVLGHNKRLQINFVVGVSIGLNEECGA